MMPNTLPPLDRRAFLPRLWFGAAGLLLFAISFFPRLLPAKVGPVVFLAAWLALPLSGLRRKRTDAERPDAFMRRTAILTIAFGAGQVWWARMAGLSWPTTLALLLWTESLGSAIAATSEWWRLSNLGLSLALGLCAAGSAFVRPDQAHIGTLFGASVAVGGFASAGIVWLQLRVTAR